MKKIIACVLLIATKSVIAGQTEAHNFKNIFGNLYNEPPYKVSIMNNARFPIKIQTQKGESTLEVNQKATLNLKDLVYTTNPRILDPQNIFKTQDPKNTLSTQVLFQIPIYKKAPERNTQFSRTVYFYADKNSSKYLYVFDDWASITYVYDHRSTITINIDSAFKPTLQGYIKTELDKNKSPRQYSSLRALAEKWYLYNKWGKL